MYHIFFFHSSVDGHLGGLHDLAIVNSAAINIAVHVCFRIMVGKEPACNAKDSCSFPGLGRSSGEGIGYLLQYSWASLVA